MNSLNSLLRKHRRQKSSASSGQMFITLLLSGLNSNTRGEKKKKELNTKLNINFVCVCERERMIEALKGERREKKRKCYLGYLKT